MVRQLGERTPPGSPRDSDRGVGIPASGVIAARVTGRPPKGVLLAASRRRARSRPCRIGRKNGRARERSGSIASAGRVRPGAISSTPTTSTTCRGCPASSLPSLSAMSPRSRRLPGKRDRFWPAGRDGPAARWDPRPHDVLFPRRGVGLALSDQEWAGDAPQSPHQPDTGCPPTPTRTTCATPTSASGPSGSA